MSPSVRTWLAASLALVGTVGVYFGSLLNAVALGSTIGYAAILPGIAFIGAAPLPIKALPMNRWRSILVGVLRYLSLPVFLLGAFMLALALPDIFGAGVGQAYGLYSAALLTLVGLWAITWPELLALVQLLRRGRQIDA